jgi:hypothetical protein
MDWVVFTYSLPSGTSSSPRVTLWRRLRRLGAISPTGAIHILPMRDECVEAFHWLAQELRQMQGEAIVMHVSRFEGLSDQRLTGLFQDARVHDYDEIEKHIVEIEQAVTSTLSTERQSLIEALTRLQRRYSEIRRIDYFDTPLGVHVGAKLIDIQRLLTRKNISNDPIASAAVADYRDKQWVTRPRPHVDRLACIWLIRRFIDANATIRYSSTPTPTEIAFDMHQGGQFGHHGNLCTFETMLAAFHLQESSLQTIAEIVHEIDIRDGLYTRPEIAGIDAVLTGWQQENLTDAELETRGLALFSGLYAALMRAV